MFKMLSMYVKICQKILASMQRDIYSSTDTYINPKRHKIIKKQLYQSKETYIHQKKRTKEIYQKDPRKRPTQETYQRLNTCGVPEVRID